MPFERDIEVPRNSSYFRCWKFRDADCGAPLDIGDWDFSLQVKSVATIGAAVIAEATFSDIDTVNASINVKIDGIDFAEVGGEQEIVRLPYDFITRDVEGVVTTQFRGTIVLTPGVSTI